VSHRIILVGALVIAACSSRKAARSDLTKTTVVLWPDTVTIGVGDTLRLRALLRAGDQKVISGQSITWTVDDSTVAHVTDGLVTAGHTGSATVTAAARGSRGSTRVEVKRQ
jgi:hypothetical protein